MVCLSEYHRNNGVRFSIPLIHPRISHSLTECLHGPHRRNTGSQRSTHLGLAPMAQGPEKVCAADKLSSLDSVPGDPAAEKIKQGALCLETVKFIGDPADKD